MWSDSFEDKPGFKYATKRLLTPALIKSTFAGEMRFSFYICLLFLSTYSFSQANLPYSEILKKTPEITITDSFLVKAESGNHVRLDTAILKAYFPSIYPPLHTADLGIIDYFISGKITIHPNFDILVVSTRRKQTNEELFESVYLITTKKDGTNISILNAAVKKSAEANGISTQSWVHKDYKVMVSRKQNAQTKGLGFSTQKYRINDEGNFVYFPKWSN